MFTLRIPVALDATTTPLLHDTIEALLVKRSASDEGERAGFANCDWSVDIHTVESAVDLLNRRGPNSTVHTVMIDAESFGYVLIGLSTTYGVMSRTARTSILFGRPVVGNTRDYRNFLTQLDTDVEAGALRRVAHLIEALTLRDDGNSTVDGSDLSCTILVADDNVTNQRTAKLVLESAGHRVTVVDDGEEALDALERGVYDIAFMDMHMPNMSGIEAAKLYQFIQPVERTPIVMLTADATESAKTQADSAKVTAYLTKPIRLASYSPPCASTRNTVRSRPRR